MPARLDICTASMPFAVQLMNIFMVFSYIVYSRVVMDISVHISAAIRGAMLVQLQKQQA